MRLRTSDANDASGADPANGRPGRPSPDRPWTAAGAPPPDGPRLSTTLRLLRSTRVVLLLLAILAALALAMRGASLRREPTPAAWLDALAIAGFAATCIAASGALGHRPGAASFASAVAGLVATLVHLASGTPLVSNTVDLVFAGFVCAALFAIADRLRGARAMLETFHDHPGVRALARHFEPSRRGPVSSSARVPDRDAPSGRRSSWFWAGVTGTVFVAATLVIEALTAPPLPLERFAKLWNESPERADREFGGRRSFSYDARKLGLPEDANLDVAYDPSVPIKGGRDPIVWFVNTFRGQFLIGAVEVDLPLVDQPWTALRFRFRCGLDHSWRLGTVSRIDVAAPPEPPGPSKG